MDDITDDEIDNLMKNEDNLNLIENNGETKKSLTARQVKLKI